MESQRAEAFLTTDQERIHAAITASAGGHMQLDVMVKDQLRTWLLRETLAAAKAREGAADETAAGLYNNAASVANTFGEHNEALLYFKKVLTIYREVVGERHPHTAVTCNNMAVVFSKQGRFAEAREYSGKALAIRREVLGERYPDTAMAYNNMANVFSNQGRLEEAQEYYEKALAIRREVLGEQHKDTLTPTTAWRLSF